MEFASDGEIDSENEEDDEQGVASAMNQSILSTASTASESDDEDRPSFSKPKGKIQCKSMEEKLDTLTNTLQVMQEMMIKKGFFEDGKNDTAAKKTKKGKKSVNSHLGSGSDVTVYKNAVEFVEPVANETELRVDKDIVFKRRKERMSSSSEEPIDTSDEMFDAEINDMPGDFIAECFSDAKRMATQTGAADGKGWCSDHPDKGDELIRKAEAAKARMLAVPGNENSANLLRRFFEGPEMGAMRIAQQHSVLVDENYMSIGTHLRLRFKTK